MKFFENRICVRFFTKFVKIGLIELINTVSGYKKGSKIICIFSDLKSMMSQLSNALPIVFISLKLVKLQQIKVLPVAAAKGHQTLPAKLLVGNIFDGLPRILLNLPV